MSKTLINFGMITFSFIWNKGQPHEIIGTTFDDCFGKHQKVKILFFYFKDKISKINGISHFYIYEHQGMRDILGATNQKFEQNTFCGVLWLTLIRSV